MNPPRFLGPAVCLAFAAFGAALVLSTNPVSRERLPGPARRPGVNTGTGWTPAEEAAVARASGAGLRAADDEDAEESEGRADLRELYGDYRPYLVRGDLDGDGRLDFAQAFVRRDGPEPLFDVAVFFGTADGFASPVWVERGVFLSTGDLSVDRSILVVTDDVDQEASRRFRWNPATGRFVDVDAGAEEGEPFSEPGEALGTTA